MPKRRVGVAVPVVLMIFNRPDLTARVSASISRARPSKLLIVADGPRNPDEAEKCEAAREIAQQVSWPCRVLTNFSDVNLGCKRRVSSGLAWVFSQVEEAIILEDDCLPHPSFFPYCEQLLAAYRNDSRVVHIAGTNINPQPKMEASYYFSRLVPIWGWATWRRAWQQFDLDMKRWPEYEKSGDLSYFESQAGYVRSSFQRNYEALVDTWDAQWAFACTASRGLSIIPRTNLVRNLGFRPDATHTTRGSWIGSVPLEGAIFPLHHPAAMEPRRELDEQYLALQSCSASPADRRHPLRKLASRLLRRYRRMRTESARPARPQHD